MRRGCTEVFPVMFKWLEIFAIVTATLAFGQDAKQTLPSPQVGQQPTPIVIPNFEVATIKPAQAPDGGRFVGHSPTGLTLKNMAVLFLLREAFGLEDDRILGAPAWVKTDRFDIEAKVGESDIPRLKTMSIDQRRLMLRPFLQDRFNLKFHYENKVLPVYALVIAKGGSKMKEFKPPGDPATNGLRYNGRGHLGAHGTSMEFTVSFMSQQLGRTIVDKTGLTGKYDYTLEWEPDDAPPMAMNDNGLPLDSGKASIFTALQEQLGLRLEPQKDAISVLVIDQIEHPSAN
jgi:bla regulator protein blaR1